MNTTNSNKFDIISNKIKNSSDSLSEDDNLSTINNNRPSLNQSTTKTEQKQINKADTCDKEPPKENKIINPVVLSTINAIGEKCGLHFEDFYQAIENNNLPRFLMYLLKDYQSSQDCLQNIIDNIDNKEKKIKAVIKHLKKMEPKFKILLFDFKSTEFIIQSSLLLYTNILDFFFIKQTNEKLYDRCYTLLYGKYTKNDDNYINYNNKGLILTKMKTYKTLINFVNNKDAKIVNTDIILNSNNSNKIPFILIDQDIEYYNDKDIPFCCYYQLQLIFDALDSSDFKHHIVEYFLITIRKFAQIKVPLFSTIAQSIQTKNISLIIQKKRRQKNLKNFNTEIENDKEDNQNNSINGNSFPHFHYSRIKKDNFIQEEKIVTDKFIPQYEKNYLFDNGILFEDCLMKNDEIWRNLLSYSINDQKRKKEISSEYFSISPKNTKFNKLPIYKLFVYNEESNNWIFNESCFNEIDIKSLFQINLLNKKEYDDDDLAPLVFFIESEILQIIKVLKFINNRQVNDFVLNDNEICIFGVCDKIINEFGNKEKKSISNNNDGVKPFFMFLYVPEIKQNLPNIRTIVFQIYFFLSTISNINITILNEEKCVEQIKLIKKIIDLKKSYNIKNQIDSVDVYHIKNGNTYTNKKNNLLLDIYRGFNNDDDFDKNLNLMLVNDSSIKPINSSEKILEADLFKQSPKSQFEVSFINLDDDKTYDDFIVKFNQGVLTRINYIGKGTIRKFKLIQYFHMDDSYVKLKFCSDMKDKLKKTIYYQFSELNNNNEDAKASFLNITKLQNEIFNTFPLLDFEYLNECNIIFSELTNIITIKRSSICIQELKLNSSRHLDYVSKIIKSREQWTRKQLNNLRITHCNFIKETFFSIVKNCCPSNLIAMIYSRNKNIIDDQISEDQKKLDAIFSEVENDQKQITREVNAQKSTNYTIREKENEREVKARIERAGKLEDLIKQDF